MTGAKQTLHFWITGISSHFGFLENFLMNIYKFGLLKDWGYNRLGSCSTFSPERWFTLLYLTLLPAVLLQRAGQCRAADSCRLWLLSTPGQRSHLLPYYKTSDSGVCATYWTQGVLCRTAKSNLEASATHSELLSVLIFVSVLLPYNEIVRGETVFKMTSILSLFHITY